MLVTANLSLAWLYGFEIILFHHFKVVLSGLWNNKVLNSLQEPPNKWEIPMPRWSLTLFEIDSGDLIASIPVWIQR